MKYLIVVTDGAADDPVEALNGKTPLEVADMPYINSLAARGEVGTARTVPEGISPGSDAANLSVMGYDPKVYLTGRSPLEAASIGIDMKEGDVSYRVNTITLEGEGEYEDLIIKDHSAGDISTAEADELIKAVDKAFRTDKIEFYTGVSYRHCMIVHDGDIGYQLTPPHDVLGRRAGDYLPKGDGSEFIKDMMKASYDILRDHPVNRKRIAEGKNPANTIWIWGQGTKPALASFKDKYGLSGTAVSAVDLIKGIAICAGLDSVDVKGATGTLETNYEGKMQAAVDAFKAGKEFVFVHLEGPDECGHQGDLEGKILSLERIDQRIVKPICESLEQSGDDYSVLVIPDHRTPMNIRTHSSDPVPFVLFRSNDIKEENSGKKYCEVSGEKFGKFYESGVELADHFFGVN